MLHAQIGATDAEIRHAKVCKINRVSGESQPADLDLGENTVHRLRGSRGWPEEVEGLAGALAGARGGGEAAGR